MAPCRFPTAIPDTCIRAPLEASTISRRHHGRLPGCPAAFLSRRNPDARADGRVPFESAGAAMAVSGLEARCSSVAGKGGCCSVAVVLAAVLLGSRSMLAQNGTKSGFRSATPIAGGPGLSERRHQRLRLGKGGPRRFPSKDAEAVEAPETWGTAVGYSNALGTRWSPGARRISIER